MTTGKESDAARMGFSSRVCGLWVATDVSPFSLEFSPLSLDCFGATLAEE